MGIDIILYDPLSFGVHQTQIVLGIGIPLFGSKSVPLRRGLIILWNTSSAVVHPTQVEAEFYRPVGRSVPPTNIRYPNLSLGQ